MGAWGTAILSDDTARDVYDDYIDNYNDGMSHEEIYNQLLTTYADTLGDTDEGPVFWLALAKAQWECGVLQDAVVQRVTAIVHQGSGLARWAEQGKRALQKRQQVLESFLITISVPKEKPRKRHQIKKCEAIFQPGTCLAIRLPNGEYGAAIVLAANNNHKTEGLNLIGLLTYKHQEKPIMEVFALRRWLKINHHKWQNELAIYWCFARHYKRAAALFEVIGTVRLNTADPQENPYYTSTLWDKITEQLLFQEEWDNGMRS